MLSGPFSSIINGNLPETQKRFDMATQRLIVFIPAGELLSRPEIHGVHDKMNMPAPRLMDAEHDLIFLIKLTNTVSQKLQ